MVREDPRGPGPPTQPAMRRAIDERPRIMFAWLLATLVAVAIAIWVLGGGGSSHRGGRGSRTQSAHASTQTPMVHSLQAQLTASQQALAVSQRAAAHNRALADAHLRQARYWRARARRAKRG